MSKKVRCAESQYIQLLVDDRLSAEQSSHLETHLEFCSTCQTALDSLVERDELAGKISRCLQRKGSCLNQSLRDVMDRLRATAVTEVNAVLEGVRLADFAVDYLHPSDDPSSLGRLGMYEISEVIGSGGMGIVLKGHDAKLNRVVALKVLTPALALNTTARKRFLREAQAAAAVGHAQVVSIYSVDEDRLPYLVMEFVDGPSLQDKLKSEGFLQLNQILRIGAQVAAGLAAAHAQGIVHRDVKPGNILLEKGMERVKLTDFGLARAIDDATVTREGTVVGTPQYMSPEQARGESVDPVSDMFSLGSVLYELASGRPAFRAESSFGVMRKISEDEATPIRELNPEIPDWLCSIIDKLMAKEKGERFKSAAEVHELLEACLNHVQQPTVSPLPEIPNFARANRVSPFLKPLGGVFAMLTITTCMFFVLGGPASLWPESSTGSKPASQAYQKEFVVEFANSDGPRTFAVDIKRGTIDVSGYDGDKVIVELSVPNYSPPKQSSESGLRELRASPLDLDVEKSNDRIKVDGNSYKYITNLKVKVPRKTKLDLDTYRDGVITVRGVEGDFKIRSHNNDIDLQDMSGTGKIWSYNGSLSADFATISDGQPLELETYNGSIDINLPQGTEADLQYRSGSGKVLTDLDIELSEDRAKESSDGTKFDEFIHGSLNGGGTHTLKLETEKGDIRIQKRMKRTLR